MLNYGIDYAQYGFCERLDVVYKNELRKLKNANNDDKNLLIDILFIAAYIKHSNQWKHLKGMEVIHSHFIHKFEWTPDQVRALKLSDFELLLIEEFYEPVHNWIPKIQLKRMKQSILESDFEDQSRLLSSVSETSGDEEY